MSFHTLFWLLTTRKDSESKIPSLIVGSWFDLLPNNPYELADKFMEPEGRNCHPPDEMKDLGRLFVNSGTLLFARIQISINNF